MRAEARRPARAGGREVLARVGVLDDLRPRLRADRQVLERRVRGVDDLVRIVGPGRQEGDVARLDLEHLAGDAQRAPPFEDHERLFLRVMEVVRAAAHAGRDDVDRSCRAPAPRCRAPGARTSCRRAARAARAPWAGRRSCGSAASRSRRRVRSWGRLVEGRSNMMQLRGATSQAQLGTIAPPPPASTSASREQPLRHRSASSRGSR